ncbi:S-layer homology domain-containing protein [Cohnella zeiphila]|uniref:S-layer homology domain-containing protein n=1 Tax=Cohnella zeiphila TaxID=2761120 RepID=A0A7X0SGL0_9BACL|nr:S-layer homology domain-containing protein [Cohnella zeiphila]
MIGFKKLSPLLAAGLLTSAFGGAAASAPAAAAGLPFDDISSSFAKQEIVSLYEQGLLNGVAPRAFRPNSPVTRSEFASLLVRLFGLETVNSAIPTYRDTPVAAWYYGSVEAASQLGLIEGMSGGVFAPNGSVTREQAAVILARALKLQVPSSASLSDRDAAMVSSWAVGSVQAVEAAGLMSGDAGKFRPKDALSRAEIAVLLSRVEENGAYVTLMAAKPDLGLQLGWQYQQTTDQFIASVKRSSINVLVPRVFFLDGAADFEDNTDPALLTWAAVNGKQVWGMFGNRSDADFSHQLLSSSANRKTVIDKIVFLVQKYGMDGLNLDFENVGADDRSGYTAFVTELAAALHQNGKKLSVDVSPDRGQDWTAATDYAQLGKQADYIVLMGYDENWAGSGMPGSVSSLPWLKQGIDKLLADVPASRTIVALPFYTREWTTSPKVSSTDLTLAQQDRLVSSLSSAARSWNDSLGQYVISFSKGASSFRIWTENSRSLLLKAQAAAQRGAAGLAYWSIGSETPDVWASLRNAAKYGTIRF